ncbi:50S ribosomal protein L31e [Infirmifilum lucidum]|uniref:50S ribosomal protein L31e n=1 Tax=Infirmifilum lucidum TaxID=2776706 RepID=UPI001CEC4218|nr:50S ribosomal protein L31e [Infirmifilum lucidum]
MPKLQDGENVFTVTIPLRDAFRAPRKKRAKVAVRLVKEWVARHFHVSGAIKVGNKLNELLWSKSIEKPPRRVTVSVRVNVEEGEVVEAEVDLPPATGNVEEKE